jgi:hypothetical protein
MTKRFGVLEAELHQRAARGIVKDIFRSSTTFRLQAMCERHRRRRPAGPTGDDTNREASSISDVTF